MIGALLALGLIIAPVLPDAAVSAASHLRLAQSQSAAGCMINCDTQALGCRSVCIAQPIPIPSTTNTTATMPNTSASPNAPPPAQCNLGCSSQQSVCRQNCARLTQ